jgi:hypothetical protein
VQQVKLKIHSIIHDIDMKTSALLIVLTANLCNTFLLQISFTWDFMVFSSTLENTQIILPKPITVPFFIGVEKVTRVLNAYEMHIYKYYALQLINEYYFREKTE